MRDGSPSHETKGSTHSWDNPKNLPWHPGGNLGEKWGGARAVLNPESHPGKVQGGEEGLLLHIWQGEQQLHCPSPWQRGGGRRWRIRLGYNVPLSNFYWFPNLLFQEVKRGGNEGKDFAGSQAGLCFSPSDLPTLAHIQAGSSSYQPIFILFFFFSENIWAVRGPRKLKQQNLQCQGEEPHSPP